MVDFDHRGNRRSIWSHPYIYPTRKKQSTGMRFQEVLLSLNQTLNNIASEKKSHTHIVFGVSKWTQNHPAKSPFSPKSPYFPCIFPIFSPYVHGFHGENEVIFTIAIGDAPATAGHGTRQIHPTYRDHSGTERPATRPQQRWPKVGNLEYSSIYIYIICVFMYLCIYVFIYLSIYLDITYFTYNLSYPGNTFRHLFWGLL